MRWLQGGRSNETAQPCMPTFEPNLAASKLPPPLLSLARSPPPLSAILAPGTFCFPFVFTHATRPLPQETQMEPPRTTRFIHVAGMIVGRGGNRERVCVRVFVCVGGGGGKDKSTSIKPAPRTKKEKQSHRKVKAKAKSHAAEKEKRARKQNTKAKSMQCETIKTLHNRQTRQAGACMRACVRYKSRSRMKRFPSEWRP